MQTLLNTILIHGLQPNTPISQKYTNIIFCIFTYKKGYPPYERGFNKFQQIISITRFLSHIQVSIQQFFHKKVSEQILRTSKNITTNHSITINHIFFITRIFTNASTLMCSKGLQVMGIELFTQITFQTNLCI